MMDDDYIPWGIKRLVQENRDLKFKFTTLEAENAKLIGAAKADDERLRINGERVGIQFGCDTSEAMADEIIRLRAENASLRERTRWIPVSERLPEDEEEVLLFADQSGLFIATFHDASSGRGIDTFETDGDDMAPVFHPDSSVLHWMPKPEAPKEEE